jgi:hypothetical protein
MAKQKDWTNKGIIKDQEYQYTRFMEGRNDGDTSRAFYPDAEGNLSVGNIVLPETPETPSYDSISEIELEDIGSVDGAWTLGAETKHLDGGKISVNGNQIELEAGMIYRLDTIISRMDLGSNGQLAYMFKNVTDDVLAGVEGTLTCPLLGTLLTGAGIAVATVVATVDTVIELITTKSVTTPILKNQTAGPKGIINVRTLAKIPEA